MSKLKLFLENFIIYGLGGIISKAVPLIMIPIITRLMPNTSYYGISDMANTIISFGSAFAIMGMYDAMYRMFFEKSDEKYQKDICSTALVFTILTSLMTAGVMIAFKELLSEKFLGDTSYNYIIFIAAVATLTGATNSIVAAPTRMQNKRITYLTLNFVTSFLSYSIAIPLLLKGYYIVALPLSVMLSGIIIELIFYRINHSWFEITRFDKEHLKNLLKIAIPLFPNFLVYWIFNSSDKIMITNLIGLEATGIYSVGAKLGQASQLIYIAFSGGWQYFAYSIMNEKNQVQTNSKIYEYLAIISFSVSIYVFCISEKIFKLLFTGDYVTGYIVSPYLFLAPLLQMLFQVACNQLLVIRKTWPNIIILSVGAIVNIVCNLVLIPIMGIEGAAIATLLGYALSNVIIILVLIKMKLMTISTKLIVSSILLFSFIITWRLYFNSFIISFIFATVICAIYITMYFSEIKSYLIKN